MNIALLSLGRFTNSRTVSSTITWLRVVARPNPTLLSIAAGYAARCPLFPRRVATINWQKSTCTVKNKNKVPLFPKIYFYWSTKLLEGSKYSMTFLHIHIYTKYITYLDMDQFCILLFQ